MGAPSGSRKKPSTKPKGRRSRTDSMRMRAAAQSKDSPVLKKQPKEEKVDD